MTPAIEGPATHRTAAVLSIGDELALGQTLDTNSAWVSERLTLEGVRIVEHATVPDDLGAMVAAFTRLCGRADLVVVTGGLGPTADDLTRFALAQAMGEELVEDAGARATIEAWFVGRGRTMPAANRVQAMRPGSAQMLDNPNGTAPGLAGVVRTGAGTTGQRATDVFCLPGPPREMQPMFERFVRPAVRRDAGTVVLTRAVRTFGLGESVVAEKLGEMMDRDRMPLVGTTVSKNVVTCRLRYEGPDAVRDGRAAGAMLEAEAAEVRRRLGAACFDARAGDEADPLAFETVRLLSAAGHALAVVESCTGGLVGQMVTAVPGSSRAFVGGWITYSNEAKARDVGVAEHLIQRHGAVSGEVCRAMAEGGLRQATPQRADEFAGLHCVAITGIAGPDGGSAEKPVGTVWIGLASRISGAGAGGASGGRGVSTEVRRFLFKGSREAVREWAARTALGMLRLRLMGEEMKLLGEMERG